jgi:hypothetical protein
VPSMIIVLKLANHYLQNLVIDSLQSQPHSQDLMIDTLRSQSHQSEHLR